MKPRHFWWLIESEAENTGKHTISQDDKKGILEALKGNPKGDFW